ncbi:MAG: hypothetical protein KF809_00610 [Chloroflexi bacterium]|nr:hypothetical protein [Chloroflexota bacterium]
MGPRLELKHGLVAEPDRLSNSADTMLVTEPATGSKVRSKGNLYLLVTSSRIGGRAREATALVAETIRREYYYDESAGVPICLEKAVRSANRRLRSSREGSGLPPGGLGIAMAVVRTNELYVATVGSAEAYLVRAARLLVPDHTQQPGLPADDALRVEVWRGEIAVGDSLLLVSRNLTEVVGTEELKNAVVTLHPQSAVEHLHHLFVAAGGDGPDAVLAIEATELTATRSDRRLAPVGSGTDAFAEMPGGPIPGGDQMVGAAAAVTGAFGGAAGAVSGAFGGAMDRLLDLMPRRDPNARGLGSRISRRESQRRAAFALLALLGVVAVLGLAVAFLPRGREVSITQLSAGEQALESAREAYEEGFRLVSGNASQATSRLQQAWTDLERATASGIPADRTAQLAADIRTNLDTLYKVQVPRTTTLWAFDEPTDIRDMTVASDGSVYFIAPASRGRGHSVWRLNKGHTRVYEIVKEGEGTGSGSWEIGQPMMLGMQFDQLIIVDDNGSLAQWRQVGDKGEGSLRRRRLPPAVAWGNDVRDIATYGVSLSNGTYNLYVLDPAQDNILKYGPSADANLFMPPEGYLSNTDEDLGSYIRLYVDGNLYTLTPEGVVQHRSGHAQDYSLDTPPDARDLRKGHRYSLIDGTSGGKLYLYDQRWDRILVFLKSGGVYVDQWMTTGDMPSMADMRALWATQPSPGQNQTPRPARIVWATPEGIFQSTLTPVDPNEPRATPTPTPTPDATRKPRATKKPS